jgi:hypothetical protein
VTAALSPAASWPDAGLTDTPDADVLAVQDTEPPAAASVTWPLLDPLFRLRLAGLTVSRAEVGVVWVPEPPAGVELAEGGTDTVTVRCAPWPWVTIGRVAPGGTLVACFPPATASGAPAPVAGEARVGLLAWLRGLGATDDESGGGTGWPAPA